MNLSQVLTQADCKLDTQIFRDLVKATFVDKYPTMSDEDVYCRPAEAMIFCNKVRQAARTPHLGDEVILRTLTNIRKRGELPRLQDRAKAASGKPSRVHAHPATRTRVRRTERKALGTVALV